MKTYKHRYTEYVDIGIEEAAFIIESLEKDKSLLLKDFNYIFKDTNKFISETTITVNKELLIYKNNNKFAEINFFLKNYTLFIHFNLDNNILINNELLNLKLSYIKNKLNNFNLLHILNRSKRKELINQFNKMLNDLEIRYEFLYVSIYNIIANLIEVILNSNVYLQDCVKLKLNFDTRQIYNNINIKKLNYLDNKKYKNKYDIFFKKNKIKSKKEILFINDLLDTIHADKEHNIMFEYNTNFNLKGLESIFDTVLEKKSSSLVYNLFITFFDKELTDKYNVEPFIIDSNKKKHSYVIENDNFIFRKNEKSEEDIDFLQSHLSMISQIKEPIDKIKYYHSLFNNKELFYTYNISVLSILEMALKKETYLRGNLYLKSKDEIVYESINKHGFIIDFFVINLKDKKIYFTEMYDLLKESDFIQLILYDYEQIDVTFNYVTSLLPKYDIITNKNYQEIKKLSIDNITFMIQERL